MKRLIPAAFLMFAMAAVGCSSGPGGSGFSDDSYTYWSTPHEPKTVSLVDTRTGKTLWTYEIPVNHQLKLSFSEDQAVDNIDTPAQMSWREGPIKGSGSETSNSMLVPDYRCRRIELFVRPAPEYPKPSSTTTVGSR